MPVLDLVPYLEYVCDVQLHAGACGTPRVLTEGELEEVTLGLAGYGQDKVAGPYGGHRAATAGPSPRAADWPGC